MNYIKFVLIVILIIILLKWFFVLLYCHVKKKRETKKNIALNSQRKENHKKNIKDEINSYLYGLVRWSSIQVGKLPSMRLRRFIYKYFFAMDIGAKTVIYGGCEFRSPWRIKLGNCVVGVSNILDGRSGIEIDDGVCLGSEVNIWTLQHDINDKYFGVEGQPVIIRRHAWICSRSTLLPGVKVGEGAVVASGAVVRHDCDDFGVYAGVPAKKIKERNNDLDYEVADHYWHFY